VKLLADENVDLAIVEQLRKNGHTVGYVAEMSPGISDAEVLTCATNQESILLTVDKDFGELVFRQKFLSEGVILVRLEGLPTEEKVSIVAQAITEHKMELPKNFTVISQNSIRIRKLVEHD